MLMSGEKAVKVDKETICNFREKAASGDYDWKNKSRSFGKGEKVRVTSGPFDGFEVEIVAFGEAGDGDAVVTTSLFGRPTAFNIPLVMLEKV
ncbi:transcription antitermination protein NusG [compost metagenome]